MTGDVARSLIRRAIVVAASAAAMACASTRGGSVPTSLDGNDWRLVDVANEPARPADIARRPWLRFRTDSGRVVGSGGCNRLSGPFTLDGSSLRFGAIVATKMACANQALNQQETALFTALQSTDRYEISGDTLVLRKGGEALARLTH